MESTQNQIPGAQSGMDEDDDDTAKLAIVKAPQKKTPIGIAAMENESGESKSAASMESNREKNAEDGIAAIDAPKIPSNAPSEKSEYSRRELLLTAHRREGIAAIDTRRLPAQVSPWENAGFQNQGAPATNSRPGNGMQSMDTQFDTLDTLKLPTMLPGISGTRTAVELPTVADQSTQKKVVSRGKVFILLSLLLILVINATIAGYAQFLGPQGWAYVLGGPATTSNKNLIQTINKGLQHPTPGATGQTTQKLTPQQYINLIIQNMPLDQKLGQMMIVQFVGPIYGLDISTMISQYNVGAVLLFTANNNIVDKTQLKDLIAQMKSNSAIPLAVAIDQEGGTVDRLVNLDGPRPSETEIGATNDPAKAQAEGVQDAKDLASYGFNLNLAPVVDVNNTYNPQLVDRTYGNNATLVTEMAQAYLQGLQQSGKVLGTLKHFPGLGDVGTDPHVGVPVLSRSKSDLEAIDWAPYRTLIKQGIVHAVMVTHELVQSVDSNIPSSLSNKLVTGILRNEFGFQGVIMTDSLTMESITAYYSEGQAAALAVEAGDDLLMGASTPRDVASMIEGIKQAMASGAISQQRIDDSVRRILMLKYEMGLISLPN